MQLTVRHRFDCTPERFWEMYWSDSFDQALSAEATVTRELLVEKDEGGVLYRRVRFTPNKELPRVMAKLIGSSKLVYEQENRWDRAKSLMHWEVIPTVLPGKLSAKGTFSVRPAGTGCEQVVDGQIRVNVMFVGGQIEQMIVDEVAANYEKTAATCRRWLQENGPTVT